MNYQQLKKQALKYHQNGNFEQARILYHDCLKITADDVDVLNMLATLEAGQNNRTEALQLLAKAIQIEPNYAYLFYSRAIILNQDGATEEALKSIQKALEIDPNLKSAQRIQSQLYQQQQKYQKAVSVIKDIQQKYGNEAELDIELGYCYQKMGQLELAIKHYLISTNNIQNADVYFNLAMCQTHCYDWAAAEINIAEAVILQSKNLKFRCWQLYIRKLNCNWENYQQDLDFLIESIEASDGEDFNSLPPAYILNVLGIEDKIHAKVIKWMHQINNKTQQKFNYLNPHKNTKIKIGYLSPDFRKHAVGMLLSPIIEHHDLERFEIYAYSLRETGDAINQKFKKEISNYTDVSDLTNQQITKRIHQDGIDILIDLAGLTDGSRPEILDQHPAPIQIGLWGYLNSVGGDLWDYIITDSEIWPELASDYYTEKPLFLERSILSSGINYSKELSRQKDSVFPTEAIVIGSFNNSYKISEAWFSGWLEIIQKYSSCWFWLYVPEPQIKQNLINIAKHQIGDIERIVFAEKVEYEAHLNRMQRIDIFADSFDYNAGASGTAAILAGVPILTLRGQIMLSRMGASINHDLGMDELICDTQQQYWNKAEQLVSDKDKLSNLREKLAKNINKRKFGDAKEFCLSLEKILLSLIVKE